MKEAGNMEKCKSHNFNCIFIPWNKYDINNLFLITHLSLSFRLVPVDMSREDRAPKIYLPLPQISLLSSYMNDYTWVYIAYE